MSHIRKCLVVFDFKSIDTPPLKCHLLFIWPVFRGVFPCLPPVGLQNLHIRKLKRAKIDSGPLFVVFLLRLTRSQLLWSSGKTGITTATWRSKGYRGACRHQLWDILAFALWALNFWAVFYRGGQLFKNLFTFITFVLINRHLCLLHYDSCL